MKIFYKYSLLFGWLASSLFLSAQNYRPFLPGLTYVYQVEYEVGFQDSIKALHSLRIDSVYAEGGDSIFVFNKIGRPTLIGIQADQHNILGEMMIEKPGGIYQFIGGGSDTSIIQTQGQLMDSWEYEVGTGIIATLVERSTKSFLGITDSVLTILLSSEDTLLISQNYGLINGVVLFPFRSNISISVSQNASLSIHQMKNHFSLWGIEELLLGQQLPGRRELFNFQIGEIFLVRVGVDCSEDNFIYRWTQILDRRDSPNQDTVSYLIEVEEVEIRAPYPPMNLADSIYLGKNQMTTHITNLESVPGGAYPNLLSNGFDTQAPLLVQGPFFIPQLNNRLVYSLNRSLTQYDSVTNTYSAWQGGIWVNLGEGLGTVNYHFVAETSSFADCFECYQKLNDSSGICFTPEMLVSNDGLIPNKDFKVFPNPIEAQLTIVWEGITPRTGEMQLLDLSGRQLKKETIHFSYEGKMFWNVSDISAGMYLIQVRAEGRFLWGQRVVIMR